MFKFNLCPQKESDNQTFIIAEVGQNHQGDFNLAKRLIRVAKDCGADCVKFQKTCLSQKFNERALQRAYTSPNSFGRTYGEHKAFLEFSETEFVQLQLYADEIDILFTASAMDTESLKFLAEMGVPFIKIGSGDANNFLLIEKAAATGIPLIISTAPYEDINLSVVNLYKKEFPDIAIGYSGHELGTHVSIAAVAMGCKILERHITVDRHLKGTDHKCSLEPREFREMVRCIRTLEIALGRPLKTLQNSEMACYRKLGKTLVYTRDLPKAHCLGYNDLDVKVAEPRGLEGQLFDDVTGRTLVTAVKKDESVLNEHLI
ncbi:hypothetical protein NQ315_012686 [Exocentrus adspersus]|uniref:AFP-like domain-containing protein n=1 Tax=Exocentrus adspersus TaxID=1586481 RepID=A0AAV8VSU3_9CUCU|nr:hypothetical protein NQ315_012686 [Exocentrus adspersus]